ncbi:hypothetical protein Glove_57g121 [Diversispora epigaea]|uniref:Uncharacterized protein n=1 Tax=Diversispora epigaea TaxID=1348612 RepID=A0A397JFS1_9GLOM|nr:hypothetical protein Glove_57g121 [Diversispora epigaea]
MLITEESSSNGHSKAIKLDQNDIREALLYKESFTLRQRRPNLNLKTQPNLTNKDYKIKIFSLIKIICLVIFVIKLIGFIYNKLGQNGNENPFGHFDEEHFELELPFFRMDKFRVALRDLGITVAKSDIIVQNADAISKALFNLDEEVYNTGEKFDDLILQSDKIFRITKSVMRTITRKIKQEMSGPFEFLSDNAANFIHKRLEVLDRQISLDSNIFTAVITAIQIIEDSAINTQQHLVDAEREARRILKNYWIGSITDNAKQKRAETELVQIHITLRMLKDIKYNIINFTCLVKDYHRKFRELINEIKIIPKKLTEEDIKYLKKALEDLEEHCARIYCAVGKLDSKPIEFYSFGRQNE